MRAPTQMAALLKRAAIVIYMGRSKIVKRPAVLAGIIPEQAPN
jgi:hypothetical protein